MKLTEEQRLVCNMYIMKGYERDPIQPNILWKKSCCIVINEKGEVVE